MKLAVFNTINAFGHTTIYSKITILYDIIRDVVKWRKEMTSFMTLVIAALFSICAGGIVALMEILGAIFNGRGRAMA